LTNEKSIYSEGFGRNGRKTKNKVKLLREIKMKKEKYPTIKTMAIIKATITRIRIMVLVICLLPF
jgi:hypothetical protein